jgi:hypothetical protein
VDLVEIDDIDPQSPQAVLDFSSDGVRLEAVDDVFLFVPEQTALGEYQGPLGAADLFESLGDDLFRVAHAVDRRRVEPVDAAINGAPNGGDRVGIVLRPPAEYAGAADGPGTETDR